MKRRVLILGSTGSIGVNTLEVVAQLADAFTIVGLAAGSRWDALAAQARAARPEAVALADPAGATELAAALPDGCRCLSGPAALSQLVDQCDCDIVVSAVVGAAGLPATLRAVQLGRTVAVANKEPLVVAGHLLMAEARRCQATILPVDSEHSAIFQALQSGQRGDVERVVLTASGGPFRTTPTGALADVTVEDALNHPTWNMGPKITIDSATLMNKALEIIEARWLFDLRPDQIEVVIHPESVVHGMVEFADGSVVAQLGTPDMRTPIQYALTYPRRCACPAERLCWRTLGQLTFLPPDPDKFPSLRLGHEVAAAGGTSGAVFNAANEEANALFRDGVIGFTEIVQLTEDVLAHHDHDPAPDLPALLAADAWARREVDAWRAGRCARPVS